MPSTTPAAPDDARRRRRAVALAGHTGDLTAVAAGRLDVDPAVRATSLGALRRLGRLGGDDLVAGVSDPSPVVRRRACELSTVLGSAGVALLVGALGDIDDRVVEAACFALGEIGGAAGDAVGALAVVTREAEDPLCREAAVAALGAIGQQSGLPAIIAATTDKPAVRRRAVLALAPFEGPDVDAALARALVDRDWQVRQAAEDLTDPEPTATDPAT